MVSRGRSYVRRHCSLAQALCLEGNQSPACWWVLLFTVSENLPAKNEVKLERESQEVFPAVHPEARLSWGGNDRLEQPGSVVQPDVCLHVQGDPVN